MEEPNIAYFRNLWQTNMDTLQNECEVWEKICMNNSVPEEVLGDIRTNIGLARLLMNQKLKQFKGLIKDSEFNTGEKEITCLDLQGFWDMVYNENKLAVTAHGFGHPSVAAPFTACYSPYLMHHSAFTVELDWYKYQKYLFCDDDNWRLRIQWLLDTQSPVRSVEKIKKCFYRLDKCKNNEWKLEDSSEKIPMKKVLVKKDITISNKKDNFSKSHVLAAKQRLAEAKRKMLAVREQQKEQNFVQVEEGFDQAQNRRSSNRNVTNATESPLTKELNEKAKQSSSVNRKRISSIETSEPVQETVILNEDIKHKTGIRKALTSSVQNKENFIPDNDNIKNVSKAQTKSKEPSIEKKRGKSKDYGKLQCVTRSAKKALLAQQNTLH